MTDKNFLTQDKLLLLDSNFNFKKINMKNYSNCEIITFDYETHQFLQENSIKHKISEDFLANNISIISLNNLSPCAPLFSG